ncbi:hypothetical protein NEUTE1DRAFT_108200 [Neurospora tetrasperma FGSC 2508]|uniref:Uncharacterized protein n=1 Tax=Neurospora tetrasperma (strain FGSC 2508 / ATCC MYA-4615 / P0657) TaxID=510951 RepID=F8MGB7_NEUT8|nr:uncharacterized protein NEUTE1DRAFT_108200 [Neurospora tetrasperma FGSC 2508]EGO58592.1 hypothetical protein NEUTE1DRAFT_108200 [Neurospora tetrasperma FGSC 2508]EGZ72665.1 hypothetical protein NEUTE2DRAFT_137130 [Neurospora tetrasperma FGSC 2509]
MPDVHLRLDQLQLQLHWRVPSWLPQVWLNKQYWTVADTDHPSAMEFPAMDTCQALCVYGWYVCWVLDAGCWVPGAVGGRTTETETETQMEATLAAADEVQQQQQQQQQRSVNPQLADGRDAAGAVAHPYHWYWSWDWSWDWQSSRRVPFQHPVSALDLSSPSSSPPLSLLFPAYNGPGGGGGGGGGRHQGCCRRRECRLQPPACAVWLPRRQIISVVRDAGVAVGVVGVGSWVVAGNVQISVMTERVTLASKW